MGIQSALVIFAKEPLPGSVKTRLAKELPQGRVLELYKAFVYDVLDLAKRVSCDKRFIYYTPEGETPFLKQFEGGFTLIPQKGRDLGERMHQAFTDCARDGFAKVVIIGTDCLDLTAEIIEAAFDYLEYTECVLGPTKDGGYYLIGLKAPRAELFRDIAWSTEDVFAETVKRIRARSLALSLLPELEDLDTPEALRRFCAERLGAVHAKRTREACNKYQGIKF